jgi:putative FmdB family regulatory protein
MPTYEYLCEKCEIVWEKDADIGKAPKTIKCKECEKRVGRYLSEITFSFKDDGMGCSTNPGARDFYTIKSRYKKFNEKGYDKTAAHTFYRRSIRETKGRITDESARYKSVNIDYQKMGQDGVLKSVGEKKARERQEGARRFSEAAYKRAGLDYTKKPKQ